MAEAIYTGLLYRYFGKLERFNFGFVAMNFPSMTQSNRRKLIRLSVLSSWPFLVYIPIQSPP